MRRVYAKVLTAGLLVLAASPAFSQPPPGPGPGPGRFGPPGGMPAPSAGMLLANDKVQQELKLTDDQKADIKKATDKVNDKYKDDLDKARADRDREKMEQLRKAEAADQEKAVASVLKPEQAKRLKQIEVQAAGLAAFSKEDVETALKLTDAQKKDIKGAIQDLQDDTQEVFKGVQGDREKMADAMKKVQTMRTDTMDKVVAGLTDEQKKTWKELTGDKFEVVFGPGPGAGAFGPPGGFGPPGAQPPGPGAFGPPQPGQVLPAFLQDALKLTADQKKQVEELQKDMDARLGKILTDDQKKQLQEMRDRRGLGGPPAGDRPPGPGDRPPPGPNPDR